MKRLFLLAFCLVVSGLGLCVLGPATAMAQEDRAQEGQAQQGQSATETAALTTKFDGTYAIEVTTQDGTCDNSQWTVVVSHALVTSVSPNPYNITASGGIEDDGTVSLGFHGRGNDYVHVGGSVKGSAGKGAWSAPSLLCGGIWRAHRK
ncbi:MAG TPA: hypothetical protein VL492_04385 [Methylovirgula sp.]|jgi:hypothetical protein|nr:hypothetical protein [Methylovirgula sp.]